MTRTGRQAGATKRPKGLGPPESSWFDWRAGIAALTIVLVLGFPLFAALALHEASSRLGPLPRNPSGPLSVVVLDKDARLLRPFANKQGRWRLPATLEHVDPRYVKMLLRYEDKRFYAHSGIDPLALLRAAGQFLINGKIVSGGSTLTMQVARLMEPRGGRSLSAKLTQMLRAVQLEARYTKDEILTLYLTLAPFGGNLEGVRAASLAYFGKEPRRLGYDEAALLIALPQSPESRRPDRFRAAARRARDHVLARMAEKGVLGHKDVERGKSRPVPAARHAFPMHAPHVALREAALAPERGKHRLTIDKDLQVQLERLARSRAARLGRHHSLAILVVDHATGEVLAHVGSAGFMDEDRAGQVDMGLAVRSPGSALKPFIYALAFEAGLAHPETLIEDAPKRFGDYAPRNFDGTFHGTVTLREALQLSLNVPAVQLLEAVGPDTFLSKLRSGGARIELPGTKPPDLPLALGGVGIRLSDLAMLYSSFPRGGTLLRLRYRLDRNAADTRLTASPDERAFLTPQAAWYVSDALRGTPPPLNGARGTIAFKTGTSYGYRDAWAVGFDGRHTVAVWAGRPDGGPTPGMSGHRAAAPLLFEAFSRLGSRRVPLPRAPKGALVATTADLPMPLQWFGKMAQGGQRGSTPSLRVAFPPEGASLALAPKASGLSQAVALKAEGGKLPLTWFVNGSPLAHAARDRTLFWKPDGEGFVRLTITDAAGTSDSVAFQLEKEPSRVTVP